MSTLHSPPLAGSAVTTAGPHPQTPEQPLFEAESMMAKLSFCSDREEPLPSLAHPSVLRLRQYNAKQPLLKLPDEIICTIFRYTLDTEFEVHSAFSSFARPNPSSAPLSLYGISKWCHQNTEAQTELWSAVSGTQHGPNVPHPDLITQWIQRAGSVRPLDFHISPPLRYPIWGAENEFTSKILHTFMHYAPRWRHVAFELDDALAPIYLGYLADGGKPKPERVEHMELRADTVTDYSAAFEVFSSVMHYSSTITKLHWAGPRGLVPMLEQKMHMENLRTLSVDAHSMIEACWCLDALEAPNLKELWIRSSRTDLSEDSIYWESMGSMLLRALDRLAVKPKILSILDDDIDSATAVQAIIELGSAIGVTKLTILSVHLDALHVGRPHGGRLGIYEGGMDINFE